MLACQLQPWLFFAGDDSETNEPPRLWEWRAMEVCWSCPREAHCLGEALQWPAGEQHGVVGGVRAAGRRHAIDTGQWTPSQPPQSTPSTDDRTARLLADGVAIPGATAADRRAASLLLHHQRWPTEWIAHQVGARHCDVVRWTADTRRIA